jgi:hypothetical protein
MTSTYGLSDILEAVSHSDAKFKLPVWKSLRWPEMSEYTRVYNESFGVSKEITRDIL